MIRLALVLLAVTALVAGCSDTSTNSTPPNEETPLSPQEVIALAGNTEDETERYELLLELSGTPDLGSLRNNGDAFI